VKWVKQQQCERAAQQATLLDYLHEVEPAAECVTRLKRAIDSAVERVPPKMRVVIEGLQALRGVPKISAVSIVAELGEGSRFATARGRAGA
jgi:transposase